MEQPAVRRKGLPLEVDGHDLVAQQLAHVVPDAVLRADVPGIHQIAHVKDDLQVRAAHRVQNMPRRGGGVHAVVGHRLYGDGHAQCLGGGQNVRQTAAEQLLRFLAGRTGRLLFHAGRLGADAPGTQRLADGQLALEVRRILQTALIVDGQLHVGPQHGHLNAVRLSAATVSATSASVTSA